MCTKHLDLSKNKSLITEAMAYGETAVFEYRDNGRQLMERITDPFICIK